MNKDLDERLIPKGEYREAQNIHISQSEGSDVGAIENILSNSDITTAITLPSTNDTEEYEVVGYCKDLAKKRIIYFVTNFRGKVFTDDIRTIDRQLNAGTNQYSDLRHHSYIVLYDIEEAAQYTLVSGHFLNLSKNHLITGVQIIDDLLFWTDNFNQPRKINIQTALDNYGNGSNQYYDCEETISVAKYSPYKAIMLHNDAGTGGLPTVDANIESDYIKEKFVRFSYRFKYDDGEYSLIAPFTQAVFEPLNSGLITNSANDNERNTTTSEPTVLTGKKEVYKKGIVDIMQNRINKVELRVPLPNKNEFVTSSPGSTYSNPYHIEEIDILLKESDGVSFKLVKNIKISEIPSTDIEAYTVKPRSNSSKYYRQAYKCTYKSSEPYEVLTENQVNRVFDQVPIMAKTLEIVGNRVVFGNYVENYNYPVDSSGKKGINYTVNSVTKGVVDQAGQSGSEPYLNGIKQWLSKTYKYHTVKQRRTYQVGIVFSDIYGRQSPVILSSNTSEDNPDTYTLPAVGSSFGTNTDAVWNTTHNSYGKSLVVEFEDTQLTSDPKFAANMTVGSKYNPYGWYSYRIVVKQKEQEYYNIYAPHTFDGWNNVSEQPEDTLTGGRSWLFLHGDNVNKVPRSLNDTDINREGTMGSNVRLYPKVIFDTDGESKINNSYHELTEVISLGTAYEQNLYISGDDNKSGTGGFTVYKFVYGKDKNPLVGELQNMKAYTGTTSNNKANVFFARTDKTKQTTFNLDADQLGTAATIANDQLNGYSINFTSLALHTDVTVEDTIASQEAINLSSPQTVKDADKLVFSKYYEGLSVFETEPFVSKLDIYYETSTSGLVSDLIEEINVADDDLPTGLTIKQDTYNFGTGQNPVPTTPANNLDGTPRYGVIAFLYENTTSGTYIGDLDATEAPNATIKDLAFALNKVTRISDSLDVTSSFAVELDTSDSKYKLKTNDTFTFRGNSHDMLDIRIAVTDNDTNETAFLSVDVEIKNSVPTIDSLSGPLEVLETAGPNSEVINTSNNVTNGGLSTTGDVNKFTDIDVKHNFANAASLNNYFVITRPSPDKYILKTSDQFNLLGARSFFANSSSNREVTITVTDAAGLSASSSVVIDQDDTVVVSGVLSPENGTSKQEILNAIDNNEALSPVYYATAGTGTTPESDDEYTYELKLFVGNKVFTKGDLSETIPGGTYIGRYSYNIITRADGFFTESVFARIVTIGTTGIVTSVDDDIRLDDF